MSTATQLSSLLAAPSDSVGQQHAASQIASTLPSPIIPSKLHPVLSPLLMSEQLCLSTLSASLATSTSSIDALVSSTKAHLADVLARTQDLRNSHEALEDALIDHRELLESSPSQRAQGGGGTLSERLAVLSKRRRELERVKDWIAVLANAEKLGSVRSWLGKGTRLMVRRSRIVALQGLAEGDLPQAFDGYIALVQYIQQIHQGAPALALTAHLVAMAASVWTALVKALSACVHFSLPSS